MKNFMKMIASFLADLFREDPEFAEEQRKHFDEGFGQNYHTFGTGGWL